MLSKEKFLKRLDKEGKTLCQENPGFDETLYQFYVSSYNKPIPKFFRHQRFIILFIFVPCLLIQLFGLLVNWEHLRTFSLIFLAFVFINYINYRYQTHKLGIFK